MKRHFLHQLFAILALVCLSHYSLGQTNLFNNYTSSEVFVKNEGQYSTRGWNETDTVEYGLKLGNVFTFFTKKGVTYRFEKFKKIYVGGKQDIHKVRKNLSELVNIEFVGANQNVKIVAESQVSNTFSFGVKDYTSNTVSSINNVNGFEKITYVNIYDNIDIEYTLHPSGGIKYNVILHPGADASQIKMKYSTSSVNTKGGTVIATSNYGGLHIKTSLGKISEKKPVTFYETSQVEILSQYNFVNDTLTFVLENYDQNETVIIDPWIISPNFNAGDFTREVETDATGNVYTIGGELPMVLRKYTPLGVLIWQYNTPWDTISGDWLGTLATDAAGVSYITQGTGSEIERISTAGAMVWHRTYTPGGLSTEFWSITFNCDNNKLIVGGTGSVGLLGFRAVIYDIDPVNGNVNGQSTVNTGTAGLGTPVEVRSISSSRNAKYIFLTHLDVGAINQNIGACPTDVPVFKVPNLTLGYKCENYLSADQNGGGLKAIVANDNFFYVHNGDEIRQYNVGTGALINTVALPGGSSNNGFGGRVVHCSGLDVDLAGNVYAGSMDRVVQFDANLNFLSAINTTGGFTVYDVSVSSNGEVIAGGAILNNNTPTNRGSRIESLNFGTTGKYSLVCCDANVCPAGPFCVGDVGQQLIPNTSGGTWSGTGVTSAGFFYPTVAGIGNHNITYTLPCGTENILIVVNNCASPLSVCLEGNGDITASGGGAPYLWESISSSTVCTDPGSFFNNDCSVSCGFFCTDYFLNVTTFTYTTIGNNPTLPAVIPYPIRVTDAVGTIITINNSGELTNCAPIILPIELGTFDLSCQGDAVLIEWTTVSENNNDYFVIEKAGIDGVFEEIGTINGAGNSMSEIKYEFYDRDNNNDKSYYKIHQVDFDGTESNVAIRSLDCSNKEINVYPNPFKDELIVELGDLVRNINATIQIIDAQGKMIISKMIQKNESFSKISTEFLKSGLYIVRVYSDNVVYTGRIVKN